MSFLTGTFLFALAAAAGPALIHLLNRRRHRTVEWAAMEFLREAVRRNRRIIELRDLLLLALRTLAVVLFVLAMAQPFWVSQGGAAYQGEPVHAVLVLDNSLSMGYTQLDKTQLDLGKEKARDLIERLPKGSEISLIPLCNQESWHVKDVYATPADALDALDRVRIVDRDARASDGAELARRAVAQASRLPTKRVVFIGDMQERTWSAADLRDYFEDLEDVQVVQTVPAAAVGGHSRSNTWVASFQVRDGVADAESPTFFVATIRHDGDEPRPRVRVMLKVGQEVADERFVDLLPGQSLNLLFKHKFDVAGTSRQPLFVPARLELSEDHLPHDDFRAVIVPVVSQVPVLFIDQYGDREAPRLNRYGETFPIRRLLAPRTSVDAIEKQLVDIRHRTADQVTREDLASARLVVMAGVAVPSESLVALLREYVEQGGALFLAAGGKFNPRLWAITAWQDGQGILPAPLKPTAIGQLPPPDAEDWPTFRLSPRSFKGDVLGLDLPERDRDDLLASPFFYKAVAADTENLRDLEDAERERIGQRRQWLDEHEANERRWARLERAGELTAAQRARREAERRTLDEMNPSWLEWSNPLSPDPASMTVDQLAARAVPRVMGRYDNGAAFAIRRDLGRGRILMITSSVFPTWNNIATDHSVLIFDQMVRRLLARSLPSRTLDPVNEVVIPIAGRDQAARFTLASPGEDEPQPVAVEALGEDRYGLILRSMGRRGVYWITRHGVEVDAGEQTANAAWSMPMAVNGPAGESELTAIDRVAFEQRLELTSAGLRWVEADEPISLEGPTFLGHDAWKYLMAAVVACLLAEMLFLAPGRRSAGPAGARRGARLPATGVEAPA